MVTAAERGTCFFAKLLPPRLTMTDVERMYDEEDVIVQGVLEVRVRPAMIYRAHL